MSPAASPRPHGVLSAFPNLRIALVLGALSGMGAALVIPYLAAVMPELGELGVPLWVIALASGAQNGVLATGLALIGLKAGQANGLGAPFFAARINPGDAPAPRPFQDGLTRSIGIAVVAAGVILVVDAIWLLPRVTPIGDLPKSPGPFLGFLASFYGGVAEEVIVRLFAMSVLAWAFTKLKLPRTAAIGLALLIAAFIFGLLHLPTAFRLFEPTGWLVFRIVGLNMALGIPFGLIFWRRGLAHAIAAHFCADLVLHVVVPIFEGAS